MSEERSTADVLWGNPGGSEADPGNIETALRGAFDPIENSIRAKGNAQQQAARVGEARAAVGAVMNELGFSEASAVTMAGLITEYYGSPRDGEGMKKNFDAALDELADLWGDDFQGNIDGANQVLRALMKGNPMLSEFIHGTGMSRDVRFLRLAGEIAKHRGLVKKGK